MTATTHAKLSPSGFSRWGKSTGCRASIRQSEGHPNRSTGAAYDGSAEHFVAALCLENKTEPELFLGKTVSFFSDFETPEKEQEGFLSEFDRQLVIVNHDVELDRDAIDRTTAYVDYVNEIVTLTGGTLYVEQKLPIDHITGEHKATGTGDAIIVAGSRMWSIDYKSGAMKVDAFSVVKPAVVDVLTSEQLEPAVLEPNGQLAMYAHGALQKFDPMGDVKHVTMVIVQPRIKHVSELTLSVDDLEAFIAKVRVAAEETRSESPKFNPTADNCTFCNGRLTCTARETLALNAAIEDFATVDAPAKTRQIQEHNIGELYELLPLIRKWCDDVEERTLQALDNGKPVIRADGSRYKLVTGKRGARKWVNESQVIALMNEMNIPDSVMYQRSLISPSVAEKLSAERKRRNCEVTAADKPPIGPLKWKRLCELITQAEGKAEVALESDPRPARKGIDLIDADDIPAV